MATEYSRPVPAEEQPQRRPEPIPLPDDEDEDVRTVYKAPKPHAEPRTRRND